MALNFYGASHIVSMSIFAEFMKQRRHSGTGADRTYSYSAHRRGAGSYHGGVARWLR